MKEATVTKIEFKNRPNPEHHLNGKIVWESRSAAVVAVIFGKFKGNIYVLMEKRSKKMDQPGKWCLPCGYMDWDENGWEAITREIYEETSLYLPNYDSYLVNRNKKRPFFVNTEPTENRQNIALTYGAVFDFKDGLPEKVYSYINSEIDEVQWVKLNDVNGLSVAFEHDRRICQAEKYFSKHLLPWWKWIVKKICC